MQQKSILYVIYRKYDIDIFSVYFLCKILNIILILLNINIIVINRSGIANFAISGNYNKKLINNFKYKTTLFVNAIISFEKLEIIFIISNKILFINFNLKS